MWNKVALPFALMGLDEVITQHAAASFPYECIGFIVRKEDTYWGMPLPAFSSHSHAYVYPDVLIQSAYALAVADTSIVAVYHSHPAGFTHPSSSDDLYANWSPTHLLACLTDGGWHVHAYRWSS